MYYRYNDLIEEHKKLFQLKLSAKDCDTEFKDQNRKISGSIPGQYFSILTFDSVS